MTAILHVVREVRRIITVEIPGEDRFERHNVPLVGIGSSTAGVASVDRHPGQELKGGQAVSKGLTDTLVRFVGAVGHPDFGDGAGRLGLGEGILQMQVRVTPAQPVIGPRGVGVDITHNRHLDHVYRQVADCARPHGLGSPERHPRLTLLDNSGERVGHLEGIGTRGRWGG